MNTIALIAMQGTESLAMEIDYYLKRWRGTEESFLLPSSLIRFNTGDAKAVLMESVRSKDVYIVSDPYNCSVSYNMRGICNQMSPDDHFQDVLRVISAISGKAISVSLLMNLLFGARQHGRYMRESLDCAMALQILERSGIKNIITFDAHDPKVQNAIPLTSFDNLYPHYQMIKSLIQNVSDIHLDPIHTVLVAPDAGGIQRCLKMADCIGLEIGMFYKRRNLENVIDGENKIMKHEYIGNSVVGKDIIIVDDILASGSSLMDSFKKLKTLGASRIFAFITFGMFSDGYANFDLAYEEGLFTKIFISNLTYHPIEGEERPYIVNVNMSKYAAYVIDCIHQGKSISTVLDPYNKIKTLLPIQIN